MTGANKLLFSADTVYRPLLWKQLCEEYRPQRFDGISREDFEKSSILYGDINDFIERTWSRERYENALSAYQDCVVIHDVARKNSIVHTDYADISDAPIDKLFFTHNPDNLTAFRPILKSNRTLVLRHGEVYESVKERLYPFDADVYVHHFTCDLVGYRSERGEYKVIKQDGLLGIVKRDEPGEELMRVDLYQDIGGEYFPLLTDENRGYFVREDGQVEEVTRTGNTSRGRVVENVRGEMSSLIAASQKRSPATTRPPGIRSCF
jgi:hypothetical protein